VLTLVDRIACFYSLYPFLTSSHPGVRFTVTSDSDWCLFSDKNEILVMMRQFIKPDHVDLDLMERLRAKYQRIAFFHDDAGGGIPRLEVLPFVDLFYTKALFRDRSLYGRSLYGKELYSDYYHERYGVIDPDHRDRPVESRPEELAKLRLSWNIGIGNYPRIQIRQRGGVALARIAGFRAARHLYVRERFNPEKAVRKNRGLYPVHARIGLINRPSITHQRKLILEKIEGDERFLTGKVSQAQFNRETADSRIVVSPFGWGELCLRDFETVRSGALLLKPDMGHLETWPNVFIPGETYVPINWDASDLVEKASSYLENEGERLRVAKNAALRYREDLDGLQTRFSSIIEEILQ